jgi:hypothetical protein
VSLGGVKDALDRGLIELVVQRVPIMPVAARPRTGPYCSVHTNSQGRVETA